MTFCSSESGFSLSQMGRQVGLFSPGCDAHNKILPTTDMLYKSTDILTTTFYLLSITDWRPTVVINMANIHFGSCFHLHWLRSKHVSISFCVWSPIVERIRTKYNNGWNLMQLIFFITSCTKCRCLPSQSYNCYIVTERSYNCLLLY